MLLRIHHPEPSLSPPDEPCFCGGLLVSDGQTVVCLGGGCK